GACEYIFSGFSSESNFNNGAFVTRIVSSPSTTTLVCAPGTGTPSKKVLSHFCPLVDLQPAGTKTSPTTIVSPRTKVPIRSAMDRGTFTDCQSHSIIFFGQSRRR